MKQKINQMKIKLDKKEIYDLTGMPRGFFKLLSGSLRHDYRLSTLDGVSIEYIENVDCWVFSRKSPTKTWQDIFVEENDFSKILNSIGDLLEHKNKNYGNSALSPLDIFKGKSKLGERIDDKLSRVKNSNELRKNDVVDLIGYLVLECKDKGWTNFDEFKD